MEYAKGLIHLGFTPDIDFTCRDDGNGIFIEQWLSDSEQPTEAEISSAIQGYDLEELREVRNTKLEETDWEITKHKELGTNIPAALKTYRQTLRDITDTYTSLDDVVWPEKP
jgi:hypothetical protein